ncbi:MAG TPA: addiction module protein [Candidatus Limnocylindrales bacterium]|nr:addiction module protein [Candidatus Limnocylindrales bacterium]
MEREAAELLRDALALPPEGRAALIDSLIESLDQSVDEGAEEAWRREIEIRLEQIDSGAVKLISWRDARQRLRDRLDR